MSTSQPTEPTIIERPEQPYVAIGGRVTMQTIGEVADRIPELFGWLASRGIEPAGAPFLKYDVIDMERELEIEAGVPIPATVEGAGDVLCAVLPAGRYAAATHVGHPDGLVAATRALLDWAASQGLTWDMSETDAGQRWVCRLEVYRTDPREQPDLNKWETDLVFRLAD